MNIEVGFAYWSEMGQVEFFDTGLFFPKVLDFRILVCDTMHFCR
jgi:hypothetical protein